MLYIQRAVLGLTGFHGIQDFYLVQQSTFKNQNCLFINTRQANMLLESQLCFG